MKKLIILVNIHYPLFFKRDIHEGYLSLENADNKQSNFATEWKNSDKGIKETKETSFLSNLGLFFSAREKV